MSEALTKKQRRYQDRIWVFNRYGQKCAYCGSKVTMQNMQADHIIAKAIGGSSYKENLNPSCKKCNIRKGALVIEKFRNEISRDVFQLKRDSPKFRTLLRFGLIKETNKSIIFHFESHLTGGMETK